MSLPSLNDELRDLSRSVNDMAQRLSQYQDQTRQTERLRLLGQVSGGLAHQLRNAAVGARLAIQLHIEDLADDANREALNVALRQLAIVEMHVKKFLDLGKALELDRQSCQLEAIVTEAISLIRPQCAHAGIQLRESEAPKVHVGQDIKIKVLAYPDRTFSGKLSYVATAIDPVTRRLLVRATLDNAEGLLRPEMFANVTILTGNSDSFVGVPRGAVIYEGSAARIWVARDDRSLELRPVELGLVSGNTIQVLKGLKAGEKVVTRGSLFIDREASAN